jgi:uncharacterized protein YdaU (DUF1376 family)
MNWYPRYTGDYSRDTAHLTMTEHGAFNLMLDHYYATENPLPESIDQIYRITGAFRQEEQAAAQAVLKQYFKHAPGIGYRNGKADSVIAEQNAKHAKAVTKATNAAENRWSRVKDASSNATSTPQAMHKQCHPEPEPEPEPKARAQKQKPIAPGVPDASKPRKQNLEFNALAEIDGGAAEITPSAAGRVAKALQGIKAASPDVTADEIKRRARNYKTWFDSAACTSTALAMHWAKCRTPKLNAAEVQQQQRITFGLNQ